MKFKSIQAALQVSRKKWITPHYIRIFLTGEDVYRIANTTVGVNNKILIPPKGVDKIYFPEFNDQTMEWVHPPEAVRPIVRTYTHRGINLETNEIWIDFVAHGEEGPASAWATHAAVGDVLGVLMRDGKSELFPLREKYLLVGDATALPVLGAILEHLPATAKAICILEVHDKQDEQILKTDADVEFIWLHNDAPQKGSLLSKLIARIQLPEKSRFAYIAAEYDTVKSIRSYLRQEKNWQRDELYAYAYWKAGVAEDKSSAERHAEKEKTT
ncbi:siderophore-interacting protein [Olivibacter ginsenosidimutans]|uniref:Siderophore-interacting protein n=1 Tax=Olivibacter ginsenosidimutans TaxID=1176537 RepID=A0ABP9BZQ6_9SPHI